MFRGLKNLIKNQLDAVGLVRRDKYNQEIRRRAVQQILTPDERNQLLLNYHGQTFPAQINYVRKPVLFADHGNKNGEFREVFEQVGVVVKVYMNIKYGTQI